MVGKQHWKRSNPRVERTLMSLTKALGAPIYPVRFGSKQTPSKERRVKVQQSSMLQ